MTLVAFGLFVCDLHLCQAASCRVDQKKWSARLGDRGNACEISVGSSTCLIICLKSESFLFDVRALTLTNGFPPSSELLISLGTSPWRPTP